ncbi:MAG: protein translocase subunit SecF [Gammaproteobacteria bacterium]|nr:protein translocase subunit SecF [Gammaproteobacteria bacterium]
MQLIRDNLAINFMALRKPAVIFSATLILIALASFITRGLNFGIDFTGGYLIEVGYEEAVELNEVRDLLAKNGISDAIVQHFGAQKDVLVRLVPKGEMTEGAKNAAIVSDEILTILKQGNKEVSMRRVEFVGPQVGGELKNMGGLAMLLALFCIMIYIMIRFEWKFSVGAVIALAHDVIITIGVFSVVQVNFDLTVLAAILAVIGYSLNDTVVVYDRIRENFHRMRKEGATEIVNVSINQTLSRTLMTSFTTLLVLGSLFSLGGEVIHSFALALLVGIIIGTYSSIFVASPLVLALGLSREDMLAVKKEGAAVDQTP